jgi:predicted RND superfamily exporter protein
MNIIELKERQNISDNIKLNRIYVQFGELLKELDQKELPHKIIESINQDVEELNATNLINNELKKLVKDKQTKIIKLVEKELKFVPKNYYRNIWLALGMTIFGLPFGVALGLGTGNMGLLGAGLPIGMIIGIAVGAGMDKKALEERRQLNIEIKY